MQRHAPVFFLFWNTKDVVILLEKTEGSRGLFTLTLKPRQTYDIPCRVFDVLPRSFPQVFAEAGHSRVPCVLSKGGAKSYVDSACVVVLYTFRAQRSARHEMVALGVWLQCGDQGKTCLQFPLQCCMGEHIGF